MLRKRTLGNKGEGTIRIECISDVERETHRITEAMPFITISANDKTLSRVKYVGTYSVTVPADTDITITYSKVTYFKTPQTKVVRVNKDESKNITATYVWINPKVTLTINVLSSDASVESQLMYSEFSISFLGDRSDYTWNGKAIKISVPLNEYVTVYAYPVTNFKAPPETDIICDKNKTHNIIYTYVAPKPATLHTKRFYPAGTYYWTVPEGCTSVDVFLVGGGGGGGNAGGGGGYTKTFKGDNEGWRDNGPVGVLPGQQIQIIVGKGGEPGSQKGAVSSSEPGGDGGFSQFLNSEFRALGGKGGHGYYLSGSYGGDGGSGGGAYRPGGEDGGDGIAAPNDDGVYYKGQGQGHTTRDFGKPNGKRNAGGGGGASSNGLQPGGSSDYTQGAGENGGSANSNGGPGGGGGGYGGGGGAARQPSPGSADNSGGRGGDGTVLIRYYSNE